ncbi:MAG: hypothetical protein U9Q94_01205 [Candidatus Bipolaricaulota bacterium]|nr:hypothetical protein [Candidatus Bipolaricaulota bacterium]
MSSNSEVTLLRVIVVVVVSLGLLLALSACMGQWFTQEQTAFLVIGTPVITHTHGEVIISVVNMPQEGMAVMAVNVDGLIYTNTKISNIILAGLNGFTALASEFDDTTGSGRFVIANANAGSVAGTVAKLTFDVTGSVSSTDVTFHTPHIELGSHLNTLISGWQISAGKAYYAKYATSTGGAK